MVEWLETLGLFGIFIGTFLAATVIPFSSEFLVAGGLAGGLDPTKIIAVATAGNSLGSYTTYYLGSLGKWEWLTKYFKIDKVKVESFMPKIKKYGYWAAFVAWLPFIGDVLVVALGFAKTPVAKTFIVIFFGKLTRFLFVVYVFELFTT